MRFGSILELRIDKLQAAADGWAGVARGMERAADDFESDVSSRIEKKEHWEGSDADEAASTCSSIRLDIEAVAKEAKALAQYLVDIISGSGDDRGNHKNLTDLQREAEELLVEINNAGMYVDPDNTVVNELPVNEVPTGEDEGEIAKAQAFTERVKELCSKADGVDESMHDVLPIVFGTKDTFRTENRNATDGKAGPEDYTAQLQMVGVSTALRQYHGYNEAADLLDHFLKGSGEAYEIDADILYNDCSPFQEDVKADLDKIASDLPEGEFVTAWTGSESGIDGDAERNWYYGLNNFEYRLVGTKEDGVITYHVEVQKRYDWGNPSEHRGDLEWEEAGVKLIDLEQSQVAELNRVGLAQDFDVYGSTSEQTSTY